MWPTRSAFPTPFTYLDPQKIWVYRLDITPESPPNGQIVYSLSAPHNKPTSLHSLPISLDPDKKLPLNIIRPVNQLHECFDELFSLEFPGYNGTAGHRKAIVNMGYVIPLQKNGRLLQFSRNKLCEWQEHFDTLERKWIFKHREDQYRGGIYQSILPSERNPRRILLSHNYHWCPAYIPSSAKWRAANTLYLQTSRALSTRYFSIHCRWNIVLWPLHSREWGQILCHEKPKFRNCSRRDDVPRIRWPCSLRSRNYISRQSLLWGWHSYFYLFSSGKLSRTGSTIRTSICLPTKSS